MAEKKRINPFLWVVVAVVLVLFITLFIASRGDRYQAIGTLPSYDPNSQPKDGDTQSDTIKALQAYAKEAVGKAEALNASTRQQARQVQENRSEVERLTRETKGLSLHG